MIIETAVRKGTPSLIGLWGGSASGKTYTALQIARGLVGPKGHIGMIDTENRRAEFYAELAGGWDHLDLQPPFTPQRYTEALKAFEAKRKYGCVIVDSMSHVWAGEGGVLETVDKNSQKGLMKWKAPKMAYNQMFNHLLRAPFHVIFCMRAKNSVTQADGDVKSDGLVPICQPQFIFEMTVSVLLGPDHMPAFPGGGVESQKLIPAIKAPEALYATIKAGEFMGIKNGEAIQDWVSDGVEVDEEFEALKREVRDVATMGTDRMREYWGALDKPVQHSLKTLLPELRLTAENADAEPVGEPVDLENPFPETPEASDEPAESI